MKYPATIIQSEYTDFAIWSRPAVRGWEVILATQIGEKYRHEGGSQNRFVFTCTRKREVAKKIQEAIQSAIDSINKTMLEVGDEDEYTISIGQGFVDDGEVVH